MPKDASRVNVHGRPPPWYCGVHERRREAHRSGPLPVERRHGGAPAARFIAELLRPLIARWLQRERRNAFTGANTFFYFVEGDPKRYRAPDVYVIDGVPQDAPEVGSWKTWEGHRPSFALEIVGDDYKKDYRDAPADYDAKGVAEAVIFDP